jgi:predicted DNA-binding transcriptional regulator AlpA
MSTEAPTQPDQLLTVDEVAALARTSKPSIVKFAKDKACPLQIVKLGRYDRVPLSSYQAWLAWLPFA